MAGGNPVRRMVVVVLVGRASALQLVLRVLELALVALVAWVAIHRRYPLA